MPKKITGKNKEKSEVKEEKSVSKKLTDGEFEKKVLELANKGLTSEKIGENLRKEGIHPKEHSKKISLILKEKDKYSNPDIINTEKKLEGLRKHYEKNKQDKNAMRNRDRIASKLRKLKIHYRTS